MKSQFASTFKGLSLVLFLLLDLIQSRTQLSPTQPWMLDLSFKAADERPKQYKVVFFLFARTSIICFFSFFFWTQFLIKLRCVFRKSNAINDFAKNIFWLYGKSETSNNGRWLPMDISGRFRGAPSACNRFQQAPMAIFGELCRLEANFDGNREWIERE